jgi:hypothetical protein
MFRNGSIEAMIAVQLFKLCFGAMRRALFWSVEEIATLLDSK